MASGTTATAALATQDASGPFAGRPGRSALRSVLGNAGWLLSDRVVRLATGLVTGTAAARYLGPGGYGDYCYVVAFVTMFAEIASMGLNGIVTRDLVEERGRHPEILGTAFFCRTAGAVSSLLLSVGLAVWLRPGESELHLLVAVLAAGNLFRAFEVLDFLFQAQVRLRGATLAKVAGALGSAGLVYVVIAVRGDLFWFVAARVFDLCVSNVLLLWVYGCGGGTLAAWRVDLARAGAAVAQSWPLILSGVFAAIYLKVDQVMLGQMADGREVGLYGAAAQLSSVWHFVPTALMTALFPALIELRGVDEARYRRRLQQTLDYAAWGAIAVALPATVASSAVVRLLFGAEYAGAGAILSIHVWGGVFVFMRAVLSKWLIIERLLIFSLVSHGTGAVFSMGLNALLIPRWGGNGAAAAAVASCAGSAYLALLFHPRTRPMAGMMTKALAAPLRADFRRGLASAVSGGVTGRGGRR